MTQPRTHLSRSAAALLLAIVVWHPAQAESSPWYLAGSLAATHDSNLLRLSGDRPLPSGDSRSDTITSTALLGGLDQQWGRQHVNAATTVRQSRFTNYSVYNNTSYDLQGTLNWETFANLSGDLKVLSSHKLASFSEAQSVGQRNTERFQQVDAVVRRGRITRLTLEVGLGWRSRDFSAAAYDALDYRQTYGSLGVKWRSSESLQLGSVLRATRGQYPHFPTGSGISEPDTYNRLNIDLTASWRPSGASTLYAHVSPTRTRYSRATSRNFDTMTGQVQWDWEATGKLKLKTRAWRDDGHSADISGTQVTNYGRASDSVSVGADYALTGKIAMTSDLVYIQRELTANSGTTRNIAVIDRTTKLSVGARWTPWRAVLLGCDVGYARRAAPTNSGLTHPYSANTVSCNGQFTIQ